MCVTPCWGLHPTCKKIPVLQQCKYKTPQVTENFTGRHFSRVDQLIDLLYSHYWRAVLFSLMKTWCKVGKDENRMEKQWKRTEIMLNYDKCLPCITSNQLAPVSFQKMLHSRPPERGSSIDEGLWSMRQATCHHRRSPSLTHSIQQTIRSMSTDTVLPPAKLIIWAFYTAKSSPRFVYAGCN